VSRRHSGLRPLLSGENEVLQKEERHIKLMSTIFQKIHRYRFVIPAFAGMTSF